MLMPLEQEMQNEVRKLEREIYILDEELEKLHKKILQLIMIRKKKEHDLKILKKDFSEDEKEFQTTLAKLLEKEGIKHF
jgi:predicted  nucleic acid-binding Zn-ribbon protein